MTLPAEVVTGKNKVADENPFITLLEVYIPGEVTPIRVAHNTENVTYNSNTYAKFAFLLDAEKEAGDGALPTRNLRVSNVNPGTFLTALSANKGLVGSRVVVIDVYLVGATPYLVQQREYAITSTSLTNQWVTFGLGASDPLRRRFPQYKALSQNCPWEFKAGTDHECNYEGVQTTCNRTQADCLARGMSGRFGGRPGIRTMQRLV